MTNGSAKPTPPDGLPDAVAAELAALNPEQLRNAIVHAQELLRSQEEGSSPVEPGAGEDVLRVAEHDGYTEVVKRVTCADGCDECPHGPYLYHVTEEARPDGRTHDHWSFIGSVAADAE